MSEANSSDLPIVDGVEFRTIERFPGYAFGSDGSVWTRWPVGKGPKRRIIGEWKKCKPWKEKGICATRNWRGYWFAAIRSIHDNERTDYSLHRLILEAFFGPCPDGMEGRHLDGNKDNNSIANLKWGTPAENTADKIRHGTVVIGSKHAMAKLDEESVIIMRQLWKSKTYTMSELADLFGVDVRNARRACNGITWRHVKEVKESV